MGKVEDLNELWVEYECDPAWAHLRLPGINFIPGDGPADAAVFVVGEAPGAIENGARRPFVGPSGRVLDKLLEAARWPRETVYVTNVVKYHPSGNRTPDRAEVDGARHYLRKEWSIVDPVITVAVGRVARLALMGTRSSEVGRTERGALIPFGTGYFAHQYHPAFGIRNGQRMLDRMEKEWERMGNDYRAAVSA